MHNIMKKGNNYLINNYYPHKSIIGIMLQEGAYKYPINLIYDTPLLASRLDLRRNSLRGNSSNSLERELAPSFQILPCIRDRESLLYL